MGKGSDRGRRPGPGRRPPSPADRRREQRARSDSADAAGPSRLLLTRLVRGTAIWNVYVATIPQSDATSRTHLEFENTSSRSTRYSRRAEGALLHALFNGAPVSRATLQGELEQALVAAGVIEAASSGENATFAANSADASLARSPVADDSDDSVAAAVAPETAAAADVEAPAAEAPAAVDAPEVPAPVVDDADPAADASDEPASADAAKTPKATRTTRVAKAPKVAKAAKVVKGTRAARTASAPRTARAAKTNGATADVVPTPVESESAADGPLSRSG